MENYKIEINVTVDESNKIGINMNSDDDITACDFIRVVNSLAQTTQNILTQHVSESDGYDVKSIELIKLNDLEKV